MKDIFRNYTFDNIAGAILSIIIGALFIIIPHSFTNVLVIISGALLLAGGIFLLVRYLTDLAGDHTYSLAGAILFILLGAYTVSHITLIKGVLNTFFGVIIIAVGSVFVARSIERLKDRQGNWIVPLVISSLTVILGAIVLFGRFETIFVFTGIVMVVVGIFMIILTIIFRNQNKKAKKKSGPMDAEWREI